MYVGNRQLAECVKMKRKLKFSKNCSAAEAELLLDESDENLVAVSFVTVRLRHERY
jgi:hypothetical protein